jgi:hypothetical protein
VLVDVSIEFMFAFVDGESFNSCIACVSISHTVASTLLVGFKTLMIASF